MRIITPGEAGWQDGRIKIGNRREGIKRFIQDRNEVAAHFFLKSVEKDLRGPISTGFLVGTLLKLSRAGFKFTQKGEELAATQYT